MAEALPASFNKLNGGIDRKVMLDLAERSFVLLLAVWLVHRFNPYVDGNPLALLLVLSEVLVAFFVVVRRAGPALHTVESWCVAIIGTCAPLLVHPSGEVLMPVSAAVVLVSLGLCLSFSSKLVLFRSFGIVPANRGVRTVGPYRLVRHPMYAGYLLAHIGFLLTSFSLWNALVYGSCWLAMVLRIEFEEALLGVDRTYRIYREAVRSRLCPFIW